MVVGLPILGMPCARRNGLLQRLLLMIYACACAIFAYADAQFGMLRVGGIEEVGESAWLAAIPSVIAIPSYQVGNKIQSSALIACCCGWAGWILCIRQVVELFNVRYRIVAHLLNLVKQTPHACR